MLLLIYSRDVDAEYRSASTFRVNYLDHVYQSFNKQLSDTGLIYFVSFVNKQLCYPVINSWSTLLSFTLNRGGNCVRRKVCCANVLVSIIKGWSLFSLMINWLGVWPIKCQKNVDHCFQKEISNVLLCFDQQIFKFNVTEA